MNNITKVTALATVDKAASQLTGNRAVARDTPKPESGTTTTAVAPVR
jgi:hypothetical protein